MTHGAGAAAPGLYVHVPFCVRICPYCDFAVTPLARHGTSRFRRFHEALLREIALRAGDAGSAGLAADTVYFGGGTPSLAPPGFFDHILGALRDADLVVPSAFVILEANPEDVARDPGTAFRWVSEGVAGVSLGVQALDDRRLRFLGRAHTEAEARASVALLAEARLAWISLDLIYGTAGATDRGLDRELRDAASLPGLDHVSAYELTIEPRTPFGFRAARGEPLTGRNPARRFRQVHETLADAGFPAYEASNFAAAPEHRSRHNWKYWTGAPVLGIGPSAHSFVPDRSERHWNHRTLAAWAAAVEEGVLPTSGREVLTPADRALEDVFLSLRTVDGLDLDRFAANYGEAVVAENEPVFARWERQGLARRAPGEGPGERGRIRPTLDGLAVADALARDVRLERIPSATPTA